jgi:competence protein ComEC
LPWACCACVAGAGISEFHRPGSPPVIEAESEEVLLVSGCVVEPLSIQDDRGRFILEIEPGARANVSVRIVTGEPLPVARYGTLVEFPARVRSPRNYGNPGAFDYAGYLARRKTFWLASVQSHAQIRVLPGECGSPLQAALTNFRQSALQRLDSLYPVDAGFVRALLLGDDDRLDPATSDDFRKTGTFHAIVISGLHISLIAGSILWLLRRAFAPIWFRLIAAGVAAWAYTLLAGGEAPVMRAAVGFSLGLIATATYRRLRVLNILAAVAIAFLVQDPGQLFEASFQLSFAAVAAIGALASPVLDRTSAILRAACRNLNHVRPRASMEPCVASLRVELRLLAQTILAVSNVAVSKLNSSFPTTIVTATGVAIATLWEMIVLSAAVQFALTVPSVVYFHRVPLTSVLANLLAVPLLNGAVGFGLVGLATGSHALSSVAASLVRFAEAAVAGFARFEPLWRPPAPIPVIAIAFVVILMALAVCLRHRRNLALIPAVLSAALAIQMYTYHRDPGTGWLEFSAIDVGQGDSLIIVFPDGETMLVDGGGFPSFRGSPVRRMDIGEQVVSPYLWERGIRRLDLVAMTHAHDDHAQGLSAVLRNFHPREFWTGATPRSSTDALLTQAQSAGVRVLQPRFGHVQRFGAATVRVLAPSQEYVAGSTPKNNDSLVLEIIYGKRRFVLTGDAERSVEFDMAAQGIHERVYVLKVGHHGSKTSTTPDLLAMLHPTFAVVSVGEGNLYGHPHPDVMSRLQEAHVQSFRTDRAGLTQFRTDGTKLWIETNRPDWRAE